MLSVHSDVDDSEQPYALYLPRQFDAARKYPLVISLHEEDSNHLQNLKRIFGEVPRFTGRGMESLRFVPPSQNIEFIVASPLARGTMGYRGIAEEEVYSVLADVERRFSVDPDRVYLTGASMGGGGALRLALTRPDVWAGVAVVCAAVIPGTESLAPNALNLPIRLFHGDEDPVIPAASSRQWQKRLLDLGSPVDYIEFPGVRHNSWDYAYRNASIFDWFATLRRNRFPPRVRFVTDSYQYSTAYWVRIDGLTPGQLASIDARWNGKRQIDVKTSNLLGFTLSLEGRQAAGLQIVSIDGAPMRIRPGAPLRFRMVAGKWRAGRFEPTGKKPGSEGPMAEAVAARHIYVYGTSDSPPAEEIERRRAVAEAAAAWSTARRRVVVKLVVKPDSAVTAADQADSNLILFGNRDTNSLIARMAGRLPLELSPGAADYGLIFIAPAGKHYVLVNSGLPWWTGAADAGRDVYRYEPEMPGLLETFGDYLLFKGSLAHVVAEGRFDGNWKVTADAAARMTATGTVTIR